MLVGGGRVGEAVLRAVRALRSTLVELEGLQLRRVVAVMHRHVVLRLAEGLNGVRYVVFYRRPD